VFLALPAVHLRTGTPDTIPVVAVLVAALALHLRLRVRPSTGSAIRVAVVASAATAEAFGEELADRGLSQYVFVARIVRDGEAPCPRTLGRVRSLAGLVREHAIDLVLLGGDAPRIAVLEALDAEIERGTARVMELSAFCERVFGYVPIGDADAAWLSYILHPGYRRRPTAGQRAFDVVVATAIGLAFLPVMAIAAALIKLDGGPVLFRQTRIGEGGRPITIVKLRSMRVESAPDSRWAAADDQRITPVGRWLRRLHVDELPQLYHVLRGDLRMVGPRPEQPHYVAHLEATLPFYARRHLAKPGLTGWAQVRCGYGGSETGSAWKLCHDLYYLKHRSLRLDVRILFATAVVVLRGSHVRMVPRLALATRAAPRAEAAARSAPAAGSWSGASLDVSPLDART
jgi:lipopolysaccharide/colanic/teichoic acid biosynthesis glycosyltransferase